MKTRPQFFTVFMSKILLTIGVSLALSSATICSSMAAGTGMMTLHGHVPAVVSHLSAKGSLSATTNLNLAIGLPLRNKEGLTNLLQQIYDPASPNYHKYLTPEQFTAQFGPTEQDYQKVIDFAKANGLVVMDTKPNRELLNVRGKASDVEKAFQVKLRIYQHPTEAREFFAPDTEPVLDATLPIIHISGLDNYFTASPRLKARPLSQTAGATPNLGSAPGGAYEGKDFRNAYVPGTTLTGAGQNVALFQLDGFFASDIAAYANQIGLTNVPQLVTVPVDGGVPTPTSFGNREVSLDIEMVLSMSPGVSNIYVYEGPNFSSLSIYTVFEDVLSRIANDNLAKQIGCSWGINGGPDPVAEQIFQQMALQGQTFFCASGDSDAYTGLIPFPSDSPHVILVGGTTLTTGLGASYASETVWNYTQFGLDGEGSSGGISTTYSIPSWQTNINMTASQGSTINRNVPDVAMTGDNVWIIYGGGFSQAEAGTSCAAPLWAGFTALINQQATNLGHAAVGFINPALYAIAKSANYANCFHDITTGNNEWSGSPNLFSAVTGYDLCTGLGTPNGTNLINALTAVGVTNTITHISAPPPPYGTNLATLNGSNPNGTWELFAQDVSPLDTGIISNGWWVALTTANPVGFAADSALTMKASATNVLVGSNVVYSLTVTNYGPSGSTNVIVSDSLPSGATFVSASSTQGAVSRDGFTVVWNVGNLAVNNGAAMTLTLQPNVVGTFANFSFVSSDTTDPNPDDDQVSATLIVGTLQPPQLSGTLTGNGHQFQFSVTDATQQSYVIQASTNLVNWVPIYTNPAPPTVTTTFTDPNATSYPYRFYRVLLQ
jgi:uncharacterized repeat protein (TIGR01451 family)